MLSYIANFMSVDVDPAGWARARETEGWHVLGVADHLWSARRPFPHVWVTLATVAAATQRTLLTSSFANNLLRSPVEFAQAALSLHAVSGGRFEAGLGAGWSRDEIIGAALRYPPPPQRAGRYIEAVQIVRALLHTGSCRWTGEHYDVDVPALGPRPSVPPLLVGSLGGPRMIREATPHLDRVELKANSIATRDGTLDLAKLGQIPRSHLREMVDAVRRVRDDGPLGLFVLCSVGDDEFTRQMHSMCDPDGLFADFFGPADKVADAVRALEAYGLDRVQISPFNADAFEALAPLLIE